MKIAPVNTNYSNKPNFKGGFIPTKDMEPDSLLGFLKDHASSSNKIYFANPNGFEGEEYLNYATRCFEACKKAYKNAGGIIEEKVVEKTIVKDVSKKTKGIIAGISAGVAVLAFIIGRLTGKSAASKKQEVQDLADNKAQAEPSISAQTSKKADFSDFLVSSK